MGPGAVPYAPSNLLQSGFLDAFQVEPCDPAKAVADDAPEVVGDSDLDEEADLESDGQLGLAIVLQDAPLGFDQGDGSISADEVVFARGSAASDADRQLVDSGTFSENGAMSAVADAVADPAGTLSQESRHDLRPEPAMLSEGRDVPDGPSRFVKDQRVEALPAAGTQLGVATRMLATPPVSGTILATKYDRLEISVNAGENLLAQDFAFDLGSDVHIFIPNPSLDGSRPLVPVPAVAEPLQVARQLVQKLEFAQDSAIEIILSPEELGKVRISIGQGDTPLITVLADRPETLDLLRRNADILAGEMRAAGFSGADISFGNGRDAAGGKGGLQSKNDKSARDPVPEHEMLVVVSQVASDRVSGRQLDIRI